MMKATRATQNCHGRTVNPSVRSQRHQGEDDADGHHRQDRDRQHGAGLAAQERNPAGADGENDQRLGGKGFHKPAGVELGLPGVQHAQHQPQGQKVKQRADRAEHEHEPAEAYERLGDLEQAEASFHAAEFAGSVVAVDTDVFGPLRQ